MSDKLRILHCHASFAAEGEALRTVRLIETLGKNFAHDVVSVQPDAMGARSLLDRSRSQVGFPKSFPTPTGNPSPGKLVAIAQAMKPYDLILTHGYGTLNAAMAHTVFAQNFNLPPLIHHESDADPALLTRTRNWFRRIALGKAHTLVVPGETLVQIAREAWKQPNARIVKVADGIDTNQFTRKPRPQALRVVKRAGEHWIGAIADLTIEKQFPLLVEAIAALPESWHLVVIGDGPQKDVIQQTAVEQEVSHRIHLAGPVADPPDILGLFDIFALSSRFENFPISMVQAMAAGLPVAAFDVGDIKSTVASSNRPFMAAPGDLQALAAVLGELGQDEGLRRQVGNDNRQRAVERFDVKHTDRQLGQLYASALKGKWDGPE